MGIQYGLAILLVAGFVWFIRDERKRHAESLNYERKSNTEFLAFSKASESSLRLQVEELKKTIEEMKIESVKIASMSAQDPIYRPGGGVALDTFEAALEREGLAKLGKWAVQSVDGGEDFVLMPVPKGDASA